jgi:hypothetical protein
MEESGSDGPPFRHLPEPVQSDVTRIDADGVPNAPAVAAGNRAANADCDSESADPRTSCHRYTPAIVAIR